MMADFITLPDNSNISVTLGWHLLTAFSHLRFSWLSVWWMIFSWNLDSLSTIGPWIFFKSSLYQASSDTAPIGQGGMLPHYSQVGVEVQVPFSAPIDTWKKLLVTAELGGSSSTSLGLHWHHLGRSGVPYNSLHMASTLEGQKGGTVQAPHLSFSDPPHSPLSGGGRVEASHNSLARMKI